ncbi:MAG: hypothetical protein VYD05_13900 [Planctomycetota bacterium]|nr:hypothetical protein [Planctomycetota bacterium]
MLRTLVQNAAIGALLLSGAAAQIIPTGSVVVLRVGDPLGPTLSANAMPVYLDVFDSQTNTLTATIEIPNNTRTPPAATSFTQSGFSFTEGCLNMSADNRYLILAGYASDVDASAPSSTSAQLVPRVVCTVDVLTGLIDTSTQLIDAFDGNTFRSAASEDGSSFWVGGSGGSTGSVRYAALGSTTSTDIVSSPANGRWVDVHKGQLYMTSASTGASALGVLQIGSGLPTSLVGQATVLNGFPVTQQISDGAPHGFWFADDQTVYVADDSGFAGGGAICGIQKWTESGGTWTRQYNIHTGAGNCAVGIDGVVRNGVAEIWFTDAAPGFANDLYKVVDTGPSATPVLVASQPANSDYRGVAVVGSSIITTPAGCGTARLDVAASGLIGTTISARLTGANGFGLINTSFVTIGLPLANCGCTLLYDIGQLTPASNLTLTVPNNPSLSGGLINMQGIDLLDFTTTCAPIVPGLPVSTTDGRSVLLF